MSVADFGDELTPGAKVMHPVFGMGKIVGRDSNILRIYFKSFEEPVPDRRVKQFKLPAPQLKLTGDTIDFELDNLPPWSDGRFQQFQTPLTLQNAKKLFLRHFPQGFDDPGFFRHELDYKRAAHRRFKEVFLPHCRDWITGSDAEAVAEGLDHVYRGAKTSGESRLNLLYQRAEEPAYFDALAAGGSRTLAFAEAAVDFIENGSQTAFDDYLEALGQLPTREGGMRVDGWTAATWLPFIAAPDRNIVIKPTIIRAFSSSLAVEIRYQPRVNFQTYRLAVDMSLQLARHLENSELNLGRRALDLIDIQSFMWAVERYGKIEGT